MSIATPLLQTPSPDIEEFLDAQFIRAASAAEAQYPELRVRYRGFSKETGSPGGSEGSAPELEITVIASRTPSGSMLVLNARNRAGATESFAYQLAWHAALYREIAAMLGYFQATLAPVGRTPEGELVFFQEFNTDFIARGDLPAGAVLQPYGLSARDGALRIASGRFVLETDRYFREQAKAGLDSELTGFWAMQLGATPGGTVVASSAAQGGVVRLRPGIPQPFRVPTRNPVMAMAVAEDGSAYTVDMQQTFRRTTSEGSRRLDLELPEGSYISFLAAGPGSTLMVWEPTTRAVLTYDEEGRRIDMVIPQVPFDTALGMKGFRSYDNGDLLMVFADRFARISRDGRVLWEAPVSEIPEIDGLSPFTTMELDGGDGTVYLLSPQQKRIVQLIDRRALSAERNLTGLEKAILDSNRRLRAQPNDQELLAERARLYEAHQAWEAAAYTWETAYGLDPTVGEVAAGRDAAVRRRLEENSRRLHEQTLRLLEDYGPATAASAYQRAQGAYERLIRRTEQAESGSGSSDAETLRERLRELRERYENTRASAAEHGPLSIEELGVDDLFPSLVGRYQREPAGYLRVRNRGDETVHDIETRADMRFLDFPAPGGTRSRLAPGETATLPLRLPISPETLDLRENSPAPVQVTLSYRSGGASRELAAQEIVTVYRATALTWDDSAKLAAYITPRDALVEAFAAPFAGIGPAERYSLSETLFRTARVFEALAATGVEYIEDPESGITEVLGRASVVDTVRFPRTTLRVGYGDCDDTTALLASLLESLGIRTAIMTSPGHIFLAFDTGEPAGNRRLFESPGRSVIIHEGRIWLPLETTILEEGFLAAWEEGSRLYRRHEPEGGIEFIPVSSARERFPALPLGPAAFAVPPPPEELAAPRYERSLADLREVLYEQVVADLERDLAGTGSRTRVRGLNRIGVLHGRFAEATRAREAFLAAIEADPGYAGSYLNLATLSILEKNADAAIAWLDKAESRRPGQAVTTLLRARAQYLDGDYVQAARTMSRLEEQAPELAARHARLAAGTPSGDAPTERASAAQTLPPLPWALDD